MECVIGFRGLTGIQKGKGLLVTGIQDGNLAIPHLIKLFCSQLAAWWSPSATLRSLGDRHEQQQGGSTRHNLFPHNHSPFVQELSDTQYSTQRSDSTIIFYSLSG